MKRHVDAKHKVEFGNSFMYVKEKCKSEGKSEGKVRACGICSKNYKNKSSFNRHMKTVHKEKNSKSEENRLNRSINLNDSFMSLEEEDDYDVDSSDSKLTEFIRNAFFQKEKFDNGCSVCGKICKDVFSLQRHIAIVHEEKRYKCDASKISREKEEI